MAADRDPFEFFREWWDEAHRTEPADASAAALATSTPDGRPSVRMVLIRGVDERGFVFYTNLESRKGGELKANPRAAIVLHWKSLGRQIRIEGPVEPVSKEEADAYFASRARGSQIGAWASAQSRPMESRHGLEKSVAKFAAKFGLGKVPRPDHWSGFRIAPEHIEFWREGKFRLHERIVYHRNAAGWKTERLFP